MKFLFMASIAAIAYTYIGYPLLMAVWASAKGKPIAKKDMYPSLSILISAFNEAGTIGEKIGNLLGMDYPREKMEIIVGSDGSTDETYEVITKAAEEHKIHAILSSERLGKPAMLNKLAQDARGEIFVFADARQKFEKNALKELVKNFADPDVGCVSGELMLVDKNKGSGCGLGLYWNYEKTLRKWESAAGSMLGATGAIYAIRAELFQPLPENVLLDDVYIPMQAIMRHKRAIFEPKAVAYDAVSATTSQEFSRKVRTLAGNFQIFALLPEALNPFRSPIAFQLFCHKFLRIIVPYFLVILLISNIFLAGKGFFFLSALFLQLIFYEMTFIGALLEKNNVRAKGILRVLHVPHEFCVLNLAAAAAFFVWLSGGMDVRWKRHDLGLDLHATRVSTR